PNDLRRTFASWLVQQGVPLLTVATLMGHSSTRMVERVYGRLSKQNLDSAIALLPSFRWNGESE
ncbi:MAG: tyrosine-type recombinase/integrase, partial [Tepidisphaeraceae bacterium]